MAKIDESIFSALIKMRRLLSVAGMEQKIKRLPLSVSAYKVLYRHLRPKGIVLAKIQDHKMYIDPQDLGIARNLLTHGVWERHLTDLFKSLVKKGMVVVDVGAHIGYYTLLAAHLVGEEGKVFAFEPAPANLVLLCRSIEANGFKNVTPVQKAVSNKRGIAKLFLSSESSGDHRMYNSHPAANFVEVETITLDEYFEDRDGRIDVIKVDAEGAEMAILQGMSRLLASNPNLIFITEFLPRAIRAFGHSPREYVKRIAEYGFKIDRVIEETGKIQFLGSDNLDNFIDSLLQKSSGEDSANLLCLKGGEMAGSDFIC